MNLLSKIFSKPINKENKKTDREKKESVVSKIGREQFLKLKEKGLQIPVFTF